MSVERYRLTWASSLFDLSPDDIDENVFMYKLLWLKKKAVWKQSFFKF